MLKHEEKSGENLTKDNQFNPILYNNLDKEKTESIKLLVTYK